MLGTGQGSLLHSHVLSRLGLQRAERSAPEPDQRPGRIVTPSALCTHIYDLRIA